MTTQIPDSCTFNGRKWAIDRWIGDYDCIPTNEALGFNAITENTANWSGRIDHFMVHEDRLHLFKIEVNLTDSFQDFLPKGTRREIVLRYEPMVASDGTRKIRETRLEYLIFDDLVVTFSGDLVLTYPYCDDWEQPLPFEDDIYEVTEDIVLSFTNGILIPDE